LKWNWIAEAVINPIVVIPSILFGSFQGTDKYVSFLLGNGCPANRARDLVWQQLLRPLQNAVEMELVAVFLEIWLIALKRLNSVIQRIVIIILRLVGDDKWLKANGTIVVIWLHRAVFGKNDSNVLAFVQR